jgi:hypothetical protein
MSGAAPTIDWTPSDQYPENTCECACGAIYRSHTKAVMIDGSFRLVARRACPGCGRTVGNVWMARSDPETMTIRGKR